MSLAEPGPPAGTAAITLEFDMIEADMIRLLRHPALQTARAGPIRTVSVKTIWHDTADASLATRGLALCQPQAKAGLWRLERLHPADAQGWLPAHAAPLLAESRLPDFPELAGPLAGALAPAAAFNGKLRSLPLSLAGGPGRLGLLSGTLRGVAADQAASRVTLTGPADDVAALAEALAETLKLEVPRQSLAAMALSLARDLKPRPRQSGAPAIPPDLSGAQALAGITGHLADVILHWAALVPAASSPEPVHQMRVAVRRLRSALSVFRRAAAGEDGACPWADALAARLRALATNLGAARDWDVFLTETGTELAAGFPDDRRIVALLAAAERKRTAAYADITAHLASQDFCALAMTLAMTPTREPWRQSPQMALPARQIASRALDRRLKHVLGPGPDLTGVPTAQLHEIRKQAKRLRYATEFFAPLFTEKHVRKYLPRLERLQAALGAVNDMDVAAGLMRALPGGADRAFAAGVVMGFGAARATGAQARVQRAWDRFYRATPFWD